MTIPLTDLRAVALHGPCPRHCDGWKDGVHHIDCPHVNYQRAGHVKVRR